MDLNLDAMHEEERHSLDPHNNVQMLIWFRCLREAMAGSPEEAYGLFHATARQRAKALAQTINLCPTTPQPSAS